MGNLHEVRPLWASTASVRMALDLLSYFVSSFVAGIYISHFTSIYIQVPARPRAAVDDGRLISATPVAVSTVPDDDLLFVVAVVDLLRILWAPQYLKTLID